MLLRVSDVGMSTPTKDLFHGVSFVINEGERFGLVGQNGCGKSTLLRIILGEQQPDTGSVSKDCGLVVNYMPQIITASYAEKCLDKLTNAYAHDELDQRYYNEVMTGLNLWDLIGLENPVLSGGQRTKIALGSALVFSAKLLVLDEPTNFVDLRSMIWLEEFLQRMDCSILTVSHDRSYLDNVVDGILQLTPSGIRYYRGGYTDFSDAIEHEAERQQEIYQAQQSFRERLEGDIRRTKQQAQQTEKATKDDHTRRLAKKVARKAKSREKRLEQTMATTDWVDRPQDRPIVRLRFRLGVGSGTLIRSEDIVFAYEPTKMILDGASVVIGAGEKVAILGDNGSGKSTLLKILIGNLEIQDGKLWVNEKIETAYFSQDREDLIGDMTVIEAARSGIGALEQDVRSVLAGLLFKSNQIGQKVRSLSQGERTKLSIARQILRQPDLLVLDEFTSHLDLDSIEQVQKAIEDYGGAVLFVTHDRYMLETLSIDRLYLLEDGKTKLLHGGLQDYVNMVL